MNVEAARRLLADTELKESMSLLRNKYKVEFEWTSGAGPLYIYRVELTS